MTPTTRYPGGQITPTGGHRLLHSDKPHITYRAYDDSAVFHLMGPMAAPYHDRAYASIAVKDIKGMIPPWKAISQKGATQDGETFVTALYDALEADLVVEAHGPTPAATAQVIRDWIAAWDAIHPGELSWFTPQMGRWWASVRWAKNPVDSLHGGTFTRQKFTWPIKAYDGFWRSYDDTALFRFAYEDVIDEFDTTHTGDLGDAWDLEYSGTGGGYIRTYAGQAVWVDDPDDPILTNGRTVVCRRNNFDTSTDNQVGEITIGSFPEWSFPDEGFNDIWLRMPATGTPGDEGVRLRIGIGYLCLSYFVGGVETIIRQQILWIPPLPGEKFTLIAGYDANTAHGVAAAPRLFKVLRDGYEIMAVWETGAGSPLGELNRGVGFGMHAGAAILTQATPANVRRFNAGDNSNVTQTGFVQRCNVGDQPMFDRYTCFGPGVFSFADGPNSTDMVSFGPLLPNQIVQVRTDPRKRGVVDLTSVPPSPQHLGLFQQAFKDLVNFATGNNPPPLIRAIESLFGIAPPQGNLYALLTGRFSDNAAIPAKSPGAAAQPVHVKVSIDGGNADSKIVVAGTPLRRFPY